MGPDNFTFPGSNTQTTSDSGPISDEYMWEETVDVSDDEDDN